MQAPDVQILTEDGSPIALKDLFREKPLALVFLRHLGCIFCRYQVAQLRRAEGLNVAFVCMEPPAEAKAFKERARSPHRFLSDPERKLYEAFGLERARASQIFNFRALRKGMEAMRAGERQVRPTSDPMQLGGVFVLDTNGDVRWSHPAKDAADIVGADELRTRLSGLGEPEA